MSDWSRLTIGGVVFSWRYEVPSFLTFVFQEDDLFIKREEIPVEPGEEDRDYDPDELELEEAGFRTTVADAKAVLDRFGYTRPFFAEIYASFRDELDAVAAEILDDEFGGLHPFLSAPPTIQAEWCATWSRSSPQSPPTRPLGAPCRRRTKRVLKLGLRLTSAPDSNYIDVQIRKYTDPQDEQS